MDKIAELYQEENLATLKSLRADMFLLTQEVQRGKDINVTVENPIDKLNGTVEITNDISADIKNLSEVTTKLDSVISAVEKSKTEHVSILDPITVSNLGEVSKLLERLLEKDTTVNVAAPNVKLNAPDKVDVGNWPTKATEPLAVRLSNGKEFIEQLTRVVAGGGIPSVLISGGALKVTEPSYATRVIKVGAVTYVAKAPPGTPASAAGWQVQKVDETSGTIVTWADGNAEFDNIATDLTALVYS